MSEIPCTDGNPNASFQGVCARAPATSQHSGKPISAHLSRTVATSGLRRTTGRRRVSGLSTDRNQQIAELVLRHPIAGLDDGRAVELLEDRRPFERGVERQSLAGVDRRLMPAVGEPYAPLPHLRGLESPRALAAG